MNDKTNKALEYVSALMDGEALTDEMLDAVLADEEALRAWHEYPYYRRLYPSGRGGEGG